MVRITGENSDLIDPLADYSSLSLFPRTFSSLPNSSTAVAGSFYSHLKSRVLSSPENLLKQAKTVLDDSLNLFKNDKTSAMASEDKTDAVFVTSEKNHQVKRPTLGLKQAKFSANPVPRQLDMVTEPIIDIDKLEDPQKFFEAYERTENAKKEMQKLRGEPLNQIDQNLSSFSPRRKHPSLMGKSATYKDQPYPSKATDDSNATFLSSEETFVNHTVSPVRRHLLSETDDKVLRGTENLLKQAKTVLDDSLNLFKNDKTSAMASEDKADAVFVTNEKNRKVKRPGLGLKQAKFSVKSMPRQLDTMTEPTIDIDKLEDPVKFFEAYERMENAKKEMRKLRGEPLNQFDQNLSSLPPRRKRPGLLGKSATYKHQSYPSKATDDSNTPLLSSEETFVNHTVSPVRRDLQSETDDVAMLPNTKVHDSTTLETWKDGDLNKLLSYDYDALDAAEVVNLLHDKLNVKVRKSDKLSIPDFCDVRPCKSVSSTETFLKITDSTSHLDRIRKAIHDELLFTGSQPNESNVQLSKSPLASMSLLSRHISELAMSVDAFSAADIDLSPDKCSSGTRNGKQGDARMEMYVSQRSLVNAKESSSVDRPVLSVNRIAPSSQAEDQLAEVGQSGQVGTTEQLQHIQKSKVQIEENSAGCGTESLLPVRKRGATNVGQPDCLERTENLSDAVRSTENFYDRVADPCSDMVDSAMRDEDPTYEGKEKENEVVKDVDSVRGKLNTENFNIEKPTVSEVEGCELGQASITESILCKEPTKETRAAKSKGRGREPKVSTQASPANETVNEEMETNAIDPTEPLNKKRKQTVDAPVTRKKKVNRRSSLADVAGSKWSGGVRRSTRIKMRPLEYWKGERLIYGRIHESLSTVIGVKYASPSKDAAEPRLKVKSFVSDEYKALLEHAELY